MLLALAALQLLSCAVKFWTDSEVLLKWITNPDLHLSRFIQRRINKIHLVSSPESWGYIDTLQNPADVSTRKKSFKSKHAFNLWLKGLEFLLQDVEDPLPVPPASAVQAISVPAQLKISENNDDSLHNLIKSAPDLYTLKKRFAYLIAFKQFLIATSKGILFQTPELNTSRLDRGFMDAVKYVQFQSFGAAITLLKEGSPDNFDQMLKKL